jgi:cytochrome o ubiquinol oxidase subunit 3
MTDTAMAYSHGDPRLRSMAGAVAHSGPAPKRVVTGYGFWIFILSDMVMFSAFFAAYAVLLGQTAGGPSGRELFDLHNVAIETGFLLAPGDLFGLTERLVQLARDPVSTPMPASPALGLGFSRLKATNLPAW